MPFYLNNACLTLVFSSCLRLSDFLAPSKETIIRKEKALKSQTLKGIRVNKKCCLISRRNSISAQTHKQKYLMNESKLVCNQLKRIVHDSNYKDTNFYQNGSGSSINSTSLGKVSLYQTGSNMSG